jgi:site-specific DNA-methyltransferase (adenine-specific)
MNPPMKKQRNSGTNKIYLADNLKILRGMTAGSIDLVYIDPPFNTKKLRKHTKLKTTQSILGDRIGFGGKRYQTEKNGTLAYDDSYADYLTFLEPRLANAYILLKETGSLFLHLDYREVHYCKILLDGIFGRECFQNEIIWSYDYGGRSKKRWSAKHDSILWYTKDPKNYTFNYDEMERIPYMAPGLVTKEKAERGKTPTDVWWHTIVPTNGRERTGYPTQKPLGVLKRIVSVHSKPGDVVLDFFAGSGTTGEAAALLGRNFILIDNNKDAVHISAKRLKRYKPKCIGFKH